MADRGRVELTFLGQTLTVRTAAPPDHVRALAAYLEERVNAVRRTGVQEPLAALTLAALDITDELFRAREDHARESGDLGARLDALVALLDRAAGSRPQSA